MAVKKPKKNQSLRNNEYYDTQNRFDELYQASQQGKCFTQLMELIANEENIMLAYRSMVVHHITPKQAGGGDNYANLILVTPDVHQLIHAKAEETVQKYLNKLKSCKLNMARLNKLRELAGNYKIANR